MTPPFQIIVVTSPTPDGKSTAEMQCTMGREELIEYLVANEKKGLQVPNADAAKVLGFFIVSYLQDSCPCPGCLMGATDLSRKRAKKALGELYELGYIVGVTEESLH